MILGLTESKYPDIVPLASGKKTKKQLYAEKKRERTKRRLAAFVPNTPEFERRVQRQVQAERRRDDCNYEGDISRLEALKESYEYALEYDAQEDLKLYYEVVDECADLVDESEYERIKQKLEDLNQELDPNDYGD